MCSLDNYATTLLELTGFFPFNNEETGFNSFDKEMMITIRAFEQSNCSIEIKELVKYLKNKYSNS